MSYVAVAEVRVKPQHMDAACAAVLGIVSQTRAEPGCETFLVHRAADGSPRLFLYERWRDAAAFETHHAQDYTRAVYRRYETWLAEPPILTFLDDLTVQDSA